MVDESVNVVGEVVWVVFELLVLVSIIGFLVLLKIDNIIFVGIVSIGVLLLGVYYLVNRWFVENVIRSGLEIRNEVGVVDFEVRNIEEGLIFVELYCYLEYSFI